MTKDAYNRLLARIAALEEQNKYLSERGDLAQQMQVCALDRDRFADELNVVIDERDELRVKVVGLEARNVKLQQSSQHKTDIIEALTETIESLQKQTHER